MDWFSDIFVGLLPSRVQWAITAILVLLLAVLFAYLYSQGRIVW